MTLTSEEAKSNKRSKLSLLFSLHKGVRKGASSFYDYLHWFAFASWADSAKVREIIKSSHTLFGERKNKELGRRKVRERRVA